MNASIKYGLDKEVCNPYGGQKPANPSCAASGTALQVPFPDQGWEIITRAFTSTSSVPQFNTGHIVAYFVTRTVTDNLPAADFKSMNKSAEGLFRCGHIQAIQVCSTNEYLFLKANCIPEMRKDRVYHVRMALSKDGYDVSHVECGCPAGIGPHGSCKHIGALAYALADFCKRGAVPEFLTCTEQLQQWNRPRGRRVNPIPVDQLGTRRELFPTKERATGSQMVFDPCPLPNRKADPLALETLRCDLLSLGQPCGLLSVIVPSLQKILHDHCYCGDKEQTKRQDDELSNDLSVLVNNFQSITTTEADVLRSLRLTVQQRTELEKQTRNQDSSAVWHEARRQRITGSKCGRILQQKGKTTALLLFCVYPKPMLTLPKPISWGRNNEEKARKSYVTHRNEDGHSGLQAIRSGFVVHSEKFWLGASPDAWVTDPSVTASSGIAEFKCPYTKANLLPEEACKDKDFYCSIINGKIQLKQNHAYYHQVQLQLYVAGDLCNWCDFCVYTKRGVAVERIYADKSWQIINIPQLETYFYHYMLPELIHPQHKPSYYL